MTGRGLFTKGHRRRPAAWGPRQRSRGYLLLPVAVIIALVATSAYLMTRESTMNVQLAAGEAAAAQTRYAAEAGFQHAKWLAQGSGCSGYPDVTPTGFGDGYTYSAKVAPDSGSPIVITATATSSEGNTATIRREAVQLYDSNLTARVLQPGPGDGKDTYLYQWKPTWNFGADRELVVSVAASSDAHGLLQFDFSSIPSTAIVLSATLELNQYRTAAWGGDVGVYGVTQDWVEGAGTGQLVPGANWNNRDTGLPWNVPGGDYDTTPVDVVNIAGGVIAWYQWNITPLAQKWVRKSASNHGLMLVAETPGVWGYFASSDHNTAAIRPKLTVVYSCVCGDPCRSQDPVILSTLTSATLGGLTFDANDLAEYDSVSDTATLFFDGAVTTLSTTVDALHVLSNGHLLLSTGAGATLGGLTFGAEDLVDYDPVADKAALIFDGRDLFNSAGKNIDAVHVMGNGNLLLSTTGTATLAGLAFAGGDLVEYNPTTNTASLFFDHTLFGGFEDIDAVHRLEDGHIILSSDVDGSVLGGLSFDDDDLVEYDPVADTAHLYFDGSVLFASTAEDVISAHIGAGSGSVTCGGTFRDRFDADVFTNSDGNRKWAGGWIEMDSAGAGASAGKARITGGELRLNGAPSSSTDPSLGRQLDLTGYQYVTLSFNFRTDSGVDAAEDSAVVEISGNGGSSWTVLEDFINAGPNASGSRIYDISAYIAANTEVRFRINGGYGGWNEYFYVDDVTITADCSATPDHVLMVVVDPANLTVQEAAKKTLIESWGYTVSLIDVLDTQAHFDTAVSNSNVVFITEDILSTDLGTKLTGAPIGVVTEEDNLSDEFGLSSGIAWDSATTHITIDDNFHYITEPFALGPLAVFTAGESMAHVTGTLSPGLIQLGSSSGGPGLVVLEAGAATYSGGTAAGRRVLLPWGNNDLDITYFTTDGETIMRRAIEWGAKARTGGSETILLVVPDATSLSAQDATKKTLMESWGYTVSLLTAADSQANYDNAVALSNAVYVSEEVQSGNVGTKLRDAAIGVVLEETKLVSEMGISFSQQTNISTDITVTDNTHYITQPFGLGTLTITSTSQQLNELQNTLAPGLDVLGNNPGGNPSLAVIDVGGALYGGGTAMGRRVQLPWGGSAWDISSLNTNGRTIMRRALEWATGAGGSGCNGTYRDEFNTISYANNDGTLTWATDWLEINESDGPGAGDEVIQFQNNDNRLRVQNNDGGGEGVQREADLSGAASATLSFDYKRMALDSSSDYVTIEVSANGGAGPWVEVDRLGTNNDAFFVPKTLDITAYISSNTRIRFLSSPTLGNRDEVWFDNVEIQCSP